MTDRKDIEIVQTADSPAEARDLILRMIHQANEEEFGPMGMELLRLFLRGRDGRIVGGLWGRTVFRWLYVELLAVPRELRGQGLGRDLLARAENEARRRGCIGAWLETYSPRSRGLYEACGYSVFGSMTDCPPGGARSFMSKRLDTPT
ncbi:MAG TPA: GNAT family N-acetyltransferase [Reyranella sp.]|nr:GNAT family N-acetyltransferase [Reyranella sp.]